MSLFITHSSDFTQALCAMLLNSLWQGLFLAIFAGAVILFTRRSKPALRYNLLVAGMFIFTISSGISLYNQLSCTDKAAHLVNVRHTELDHPVQRIQAGSDLELSSILSGLFQSWSGSLVWAWFLIVAVKCIRMSIGLYEVKQLKTQFTYPVSEEWERRLRELAGHIGLSRPVQLLQSGLAKVPMVIGHLKPVILVPVGLATALSPAEVEAILLHELAHIHRRDYLVNLMQSGLEILFFFNPAVLWVSALIKTERESCCDDISIRQTDQKAVYIRALLNCQDYHSIPGYALSVNGREGSLVKRVKRIVSNHNPTLRSPEKAILSLCLLFACVFSLSFSGEGGALPEVKASYIKPVAKIGTTTTGTISGTTISERKRINSPERFVSAHRKTLAAQKKPLEELQALDVIPHTDCDSAPVSESVKAAEDAVLKRLATQDARLTALKGAGVSAGIPDSDEDHKHLATEDETRKTPDVPGYEPYIPYTETFYPMDAKLPTMGQLVPFLSKRGSPVDITNAQIIFSKDKLVVNGKTQSERLHKEMMKAFGMPQGTVTWISTPG